VSVKVRTLAINPGSTSTKIAIFDDFKKLWGVTVRHSPQELERFDEVQDQLEYRTEMVERSIVAGGFSMESIDIYSGRGGGLLPLPGGVYRVGKLLVSHAAQAINGMDHPAQLGAQIAKIFANKYNKLAIVVNPPDTDEFCDVARITGLKGIYRESHLHALNQKETALRYCYARGIKYEDINLIVCHVGGGISITAHQRGRMIDSNDVIKGSGPMSPNRAGDIPTHQLLELAYSGEYTKKELNDRLSKHGGLMDFFGTQDMDEIVDLISQGDNLAKTILDGMVYQNAKYVGAMAAALRGKVDGIILTGGISNNEAFTKRLIKYIDWIAEIVVMPGEFELEALAAGAVRIMRGEQELKEYMGRPVWNGFN
jgi:butyrate kinase